MQQKISLVASLPSLLNNCNTCLAVSIVVTSSIRLIHSFKILNSFLPQLTPHSVPLEDWILTNPHMSLYIKDISAAVS